MAKGAVKISSNQLLRSCQGKEPKLQKGGSSSSGFLAWALFVFVALAGGIVSAASFFTGTAASAIGITRCMSGGVAPCSSIIRNAPWKRLTILGGSGVGLELAARDSSERASRIGI